ncbi:MULTISPECIES: hypothetical protein [Pseudomonas]|nr:hypothetical protein [Pseudomonas carnis]MBJ2215136.1 hypothetical protein [Pseudomonas carnis]
MKRIGLLNGFTYEADQLKSALKHISEVEGYEIETLDDFNLQETVSGAI